MFKKETSGKFFKKLEKMSPGEVNRSNQQTGKIIPVQLMFRIHQTTDKCGWISLDGWYTKIRNECPTSGNITLLHNSLQIFDSHYNPNIRSWSQLNHMPKIKELLEILEHVQETEHLLKKIILWKNNIFIYEQVLGGLCAHFVEWTIK